LSTPLVSEVLKEIWWRDDRDFSLVKIEYIHRGAPGDVMEVPGTVVATLEKSFFVLDGDTSIPYHRIIRVDYGEKTVFLREK